MTPRRIGELGRPERRRALIRAVVSIAVTWVVVFAAYFLLPLDRDLNGSALIQLAVGLLAFLGLAAWQIYRIVRSDLPQLRALESLAVLGAFFIVVFAGTYLRLDIGRPGSFTEHLDHSSALYFTVTVLATVGFGDISPASELARLIVTAQMLLDLVLIAGLARAILGAAQISLGRSPAAPAFGEPAIGGGDDT